MNSEFEKASYKTYQQLYRESILVIQNIGDISERSNNRANI